jgi:LysM repeat protein
MRTRLAPVLTLFLLVVVALTLAGCERDRPAPAASGTPGTPGVLEPAGTLAPGTDAAGQTLATPVPLEAVTVTPALRPVATTAPQTQAQPAAGGSQAAPPGTYTVQRGDSLGSIAQRFGVTTKAILAINPSITNPDVLAVGQQIKLPSGSDASAPAASGGASGGQAAAAGGTYVVQRGDTLSAIAKRLGVTLQALQQANNITNPDRITVGQKLVVPSGGSAPAAATSSSSSAARTYTVRKGDTMSSIAVKFGVTVAQLQTANGITDPNKIAVGQVLKIP